MSVSDQVMAALSHGRWSTIGYLAESLHLSRRDVEASIESLRLGGAPVIGGSDGVKLTADPVELEAYLAQRRYRTAAIHRGTMRLRSTLRRMKFGAQETLWRDVA